MTNRNGKPQRLAANGAGPSQWSEPKVVDGALCRQCKRCRKWFHIGWTAHHGCKVVRPLRRPSTPRA